MYLGVDESNHGRTPEIYVGCYSISDKYIVEGNFSKRRKNTRNFFNIPYKHILFSQDSLDIVGKENFSTIAIVEFAKYVNTIQTLNKIFMDGELNSSQLENIERLVFLIDKKIKIISGKDLDKKIKLVNEADNRANSLFRYYSSLSKSKKKYLTNLITPKLEDYEQYLI